ncbi:hypothetical protein WDU94_012052 [Cyamophila willieti]
MMKNKQKHRRSLKKKHSIVSSDSYSEVYNASTPEALLQSMSFLETNELIQPYEGLLCKYTNVVKGFQYRWFVLDPKSGLLNYYLHENEVKQAPRGSIYLEDSVISPSDEDSCTFTVNSASGDIFKLRASDAKFRQEWVNRLRAVAQFLAVQNHPQISSRGFHSMVNIPNMRSLGGTVSSSNVSTVWDSFQTVRDQLNEVEKSHCSIVKSISELPNSGNVTYLDQDLLLLKATSSSLVTSLNSCLSILQQSTHTPQSRLVSTTSITSSKADGGTSKKSGK